MSARCPATVAVRAGIDAVAQAKAYADLSSGMKSRIKDLVVKHHYGNRDDLDQQSRTVASVLNAEQAKRVNWVRHPLVKKHPFTGQPALYAVSGSSFGIEGMPDDEALDLLRELAAHATQDKYCYTNHYENGDVIEEPEPESSNTDRSWFSYMTFGVFD